MQSYECVWSWFIGVGNKPGIFEIDWQEHEGTNRIAMALASRQVAVVDVNKLDFVRTALPNGARPIDRIESA